MFSRALFLGVVLVLLTAAAAPVRAETRYVIDVLVINLREGPTANAPSISHLRTGDGFEVLETQENFLRVRTPEGEEGWVPRQYTTADVPKARVIAGLQQELARVKKQAAAAEDQRAQLETDLQRAREGNVATTKAAAEELAALREEAKENAQKYQQVNKQYEDLMDKSKKVLEITAERDVLQEEDTRLRAEVEQLNDELRSVTRSNLTTGLLIGGGLVLAGWALGSTSRKKKGRYSMS